MRGARREPLSGLDSASGANIDLHSQDSRRWRSVVPFDALDVDRGRGVYDGDVQGYVHDSYADSAVNGAGREEPISRELSIRGTQISNRASRPTGGLSPRALSSRGALCHCAFLQRANGAAAGEGSLRGWNYSLSGSHPWVARPHGVGGPEQPGGSRGGGLGGDRYRCHGGLWRPGVGRSFP